MILFLIIFSVFSIQASTVRDPFHYPKLKNTQPHVIALGRCNGILRALCAIQENYLSVEVGTKLDDTWQVQEIGENFVVFTNLHNKSACRVELGK